MVWTTPKTFTAGERLFAQDLNTYVSDNLSDLDPRTVKSFADASARTAAIPSPVAGAVTFLEDTDAVEVYDGSAWTTVSNAGIGSNVVSAVKTDLFSNNTSSYVAVTGLSVTITPTSASSKILIIAFVNHTHETAGLRSSVRLRRDSTTSLLVGATVGSRFGASSSQQSEVSGDVEAATLVVLDSPGTTSAVTYDVELTSNSAATTSHINRIRTDNDVSSTARLASSITAIEVAA